MGENTVIESDVLTSPDNVRVTKIEQRLQPATDILSNIVIDIPRLEAEECSVSLRPGESLGFLARAGRKGEELGNRLVVGDIKMMENGRLRWRMAYRDFPEANFPLVENKGEKPFLEKSVNDLFFYDKAVFSLKPEGELINLSGISDQKIGHRLLEWETDGGMVGVAEFESGAEMLGSFGTTGMEGKKIIPGQDLVIPGEVNVRGSSFPRGFIKPVDAWMGRAFGKDRTNDIVYFAGKKSAASTS